MKLLEQLLEQLTYHDQLNSKLWKGQELDIKVKSKLLEITKKFIEYLGLTPEVITDYVITGSNVNFNYTAHSDLDLHVLLDPKKLKSCKMCKVDTEDCLKAKKTLWNDLHDIEIYGIPVELYVTTEGERLVKDAGTYSILKSQWIKQPEKKKIKVDTIQVKAKAAEISSKIEHLIKTKSNDEHEINDLLVKIKRMRAAGLDIGGEFSVENLAWKKLRSDGDLDKLHKYSIRAQDAELSLTEMSANELSDVEREVKKNFALLRIIINFSQHFADRIKDDAVDEKGHKRDTVEPTELLAMFKKLKQHHEVIFSEAHTFDDEVKRGEFEGVIMDLFNKINVPFTLKFNKSRGKFVLTCKTVMKKSNFHVKQNDHVIALRDI